MRLSPVSIFLAIVLCGLPFAVTIGWAAAPPPLRSSFVPGAARVAAGLGDAPVAVPSPSPAVDDWTPDVATRGSGDDPVRLRRPRGSASPGPTRARRDPPDRRTQSSPPVATTTAAAPSQTPTEPPPSTEPAATPDLLHE